MRDVLAIAEAGLREAKSMLAYTIIKAPFSGLITQKIANVGDLATPGMPLLKLENPDLLQVVTAIPESKAREVQLKTRLEVTIPAAAVRVSGTVTELSPAVDPHSRTMPIKIDLSDTSLKTGMFARVTLPGTPDPAIMPMRCPLPRVRHELMALMPTSTGCDILGLSMGLRGSA